MRERLVQGFERGVPFNNALGLEVIDTGDDWVRARLPFRDAYIGDTETNLWHSAVASALVDAACGLATFVALPGPESIATLDLRMDYLRPAVANEPLIAHAQCYHLTRRIAFTRATVYQSDPDLPTGLTMATFMRTSRSRD